MIATANARAADEAKRLPEYIAAWEPGFREKLKDLGYELGGTTTEDFSAYIQSELRRWGEVIRDARLK